VGETYFFRERKTFEALADEAIPELVRRRSAEKRLRLWSAACCTGEEAYSLAILLQRCIPDWRDWNITILATDINERFLQKAAAGVYGEWSFRESAPGFKESHFTRTADRRFAIQPQLKHWVKFAPLNLAEDRFPSFATDTLAMDLIFCRNVLMYFTAEQARKVAGNLRRALRDDGWLLVGAGDGSLALSGHFAPVNMPGAILYRKKGAIEQPPPAIFEPPEPDRHPGASREPVPEELLPRVPGLRRDAGIDASAPFSGETRALANAGKLVEALHSCDRWIAQNASDPAARYLRAMVLQELAHIPEARRSLQQALYLDPAFVLAFVALGNLARAEDRHDEARRHFDNALTLLSQCAPEELLPESDGLTAGRLREIIGSLVALEAAA
jgi:chemotaxis protein methyltransferase CheR